MLKLFPKGHSRQPDAQPRQETLDILCEILAKRILAELMEPQIAERIALNSGGVLRELIRIANECCRICLRLIRRRPHENIMINIDILEEAINNIRNDFALPLGSKEYEILETTYKNFKPEDPKEQEFLDLLHGLYILEYRNHKNWYDVHPIVVELLCDEGLI
ncbi:hypothetical protein [Anabaena sp. CS-542/02]|uniref:hypothetical protein n=1 Tax=Anabaena sp. CS-542/02 TaxID=3021719 RepID=UPI00232CCE7E|nr:hypothetical protein [Anabaena sp. CS-542/02]